jgi:hypothetical protein
MNFSIGVSRPSTSAEAGQAPTHAMHSVQVCRFTSTRPYGAPYEWDLPRRALRQMLEDELERRAFLVREIEGGRVRGRVRGRETPELRLERRRLGRAHEPQVRAAVAERGEDRLRVPELALERGTLLVGFGVGRRDDHLARAVRDCAEHRIDADRGGVEI